jgi:hypothetical protein
VRRGAVVAGLVLVVGLALVHLFAKTGVRDRAQAVTYAYRHQLAAPPGPDDPEPHAHG